jgi:hypothetical protein
MKYLLVVSVFVLLAGCASQAHRTTGLIETQDSLMSGCTRLGMVTETSNAGWISTNWARELMVKKVKERAEQLGATHIVWLHQTDDSAAAEAYRCK